MNDEFVVFSSSIEEKNKSIFDNIQKGDLHNHALLGSNRNFFYKSFPNIKLEHFDISDNISSLSSFIKQNIINLSSTKEGQLKLFECTILTAINDGITRLELSVDYRLVFEVYNNNFNNYVVDLINLKNKYINQININYDLGISRNAYKKEHFDIIKKLIESNIFYGIDLFGDELSKNIKYFKKIYKVAKKNNLVLKAHVGEFGSAKDIYIAIKKLHLDVVQHGISIVDSNKVMKYAKKKKIQFNVCPISNLKLSRVNSILEHPIKKMFDYGLIVTINTDDQLIFENSLFDEYILLYENKIFSIDELNQIRLNSIKKIK